MVTSLREIGAFMDPVDDPISLRQVASHHRWVGANGSGSLAAIGVRHEHQDSVRLRFLWYNTFLMRVRLKLAAGLADAATPWEVLEALGVDPKKLLDEYDVCELLPHGPREVCKGAGDAIAFVIDWFGGVTAAAGAILDALGAEKGIEMILRIAGVPEELVFDEKPALTPRAGEIGDVLRGDGYHLVAMGELWNSDLRDELVGHWQLPKSGDHLAVGKAEGDAFLGDGLLFGSTEGRIAGAQRHGYDRRGIERWPGRLLNTLADDEWWAEKGTLLVRVDVGVGVLDLYLTHLYYGTGLAGSKVAAFFPHIAPPSNGERKEVRATQLGELSQFITATHQPDHVAVVCGDFNIDANGEDPSYGGLEALQEFLLDHHLEDRWINPHGEFPGWTGGGFDKICSATQAEDPRFCLDSVSTSSSAGYRIDFVLVEQALPQHSFMLDVTRLRRRPFPRPTTTEDQAYMSDHLGLDCTLLASPL